MAARHHPFTITVYRLVGERAITHRKVELTCSPADSFAALQGVREGLPPGFGAGLTDARGYNVRPSDTVAGEG